ncbi:MAG: hypothetical protein Kow0063_27660 [Anaerolineae bacterium]
MGIKKENATARGLQSDEAGEADSDDGEAARTGPVKARIKSQANPTFKIRRVCTGNSSAVKEWMADARIDDTRKPQIVQEGRDRMDDSPARFVVDGMLGSLARWLRLLGYDTDYANQRDDPELVRIARAENRVLLTRDRELAGRRGVQALLIESQSLDDQLAQVMEAFPPPLEAQPGRCSVCNTPLVETTPDEVAHRVPRYVLRRHRQFMRCPGCERVYWRGSHWQAIQARLGRPG